MKETKTATIYSIQHDLMKEPLVCPTLLTDRESLLMAMEWAATLVRRSGFPVKVYRDSTMLIEVPVN